MSTRDERPFRGTARFASWTALYQSLRDSNGIVHKPRRFEMRTLCGVSLWRRDDDEEPVMEACNEEINCVLCLSEAADAQGFPHK